MCCVFMRKKRNILNIHRKKNTHIQNIIIEKNQTGKTDIFCIPMNVVCDTLIKSVQRERPTKHTQAVCSFHSEKCSLKLIDYYHHFYLCDVFSCVFFLYTFGFSPHLCPFMCVSDPVVPS